jgi:hypothetical protein
MGDVDLLSGSQFRTIWRDSSGDVELDPFESRRLPPLKVKFLLDADQVSLYADGSLESEEAIARDMGFWDTFAGNLVGKFEFRGTPSSDMAVVYTLQPCRGPLPGESVCTIEACLSQEIGVVNALLDAADCSYRAPSLRTDVDLVQTIFARDEWPARTGEKVLVILRWRAAPLTLTSYPLSDPALRNRVFVIALGRSANPPPGWDSLRTQAKDYYGAHVAFVSAPPVYRQDLPITLAGMNKALEDLKQSFQGKRARLGATAKLPYLLDQKTSEDGRLLIKAGTCVSDERQVAVPYLNASDQELPRLPNAIAFGAGGAALLGGVQLLLLVSILRHQLSARSDTGRSST